MARSRAPKTPAQWRSGNNKQQAQWLGWGKKVCSPSTSACAGGGHAVIRSKKREKKQAQPPQMRLTGIPGSTSAYDQQSCTRHIELTSHHHRYACWRRRG